MSPQIFVNFARMELDIQLVDYSKDTLLKVKIFVANLKVMSIFCFDKSNVVTPTGYMNSCVHNGVEIRCTFYQLLDNGSSMDLGLHFEYDTKTIFKHASYHELARSVQ